MLKIVIVIRKTRISLLNQSKSTLIKCFLFVCVSCACFSCEKILRKTWPPPLEIVGYILLLKYLNKNLSDFIVLHNFCQQLFRNFSFIYIKSKFDFKTLWKKICFASMPKKKVISFWLTKFISYLKSFLQTAVCS